MAAIDALSAASIPPYSIETKAYGSEKLDVLGDNSYAHMKNGLSELLFLEPNNKIQK